MHNRFILVVVIALFALSCGVASDEAVNRDEYVAGFGREDSLSQKSLSHPFKADTESRQVLHKQVDHQETTDSRSNRRQSITEKRSGALGIEQSLSLQGKDFSRLHRSPNDASVSGTHPKSDTVGTFSISETYSTSAPAHALAYGASKTEQSESKREEDRIEHEDAVLAADFDMTTGTAGSESKREEERIEHEDAVLAADFDVRTGTAGPTLNTSFANSLCSSIQGTSDVGNVRVNVTDTTTWVTFPDCLRGTTNVNGVVTLNGPFIISSFDIFPSTITGLILNGVVLYPDTYYGINGFYSDGTLSWIDLFGNFPTARTFYLSSPINARGLLPNSLPNSLTSFTLLNCLGITGSIPQTILSSWTPSSSPSSSYTLVLEKLNITGSIPSQLFYRFNGANLGGDSKLTFSFAYNALSGSLPAGVFNNLVNASASSFSLDLSHNAFSGSLPSPVFPAGLLSSSSSASSFTLDVSFNAIDGPLPTQLVASTSKLANVKIALNDNRFAGSISPSFLSFLSWNATSSTSRSLTIWLHNNFIGGAIPDNLLTSTLALGIDDPAIDFNLYLSNNLLSGSLPASLFYIDYESLRKRDAIDGQDAQIQRLPSSSRLSGEKRSTLAITAFNFTSFCLDATTNSLTGSIHPEFLTHAISNPRLLALTLHLADNRLNGSVPADLFASMPQNVLGAITFNIADNLFSGAIPPLCGPTTRLYFYAGNNRLSGSIPSEWQTCLVWQASVFGNIGITGSLPNNLLGSSSFLQLFDASGTSLTGDMPNVTSTRLLSFKLDKTAIEFCAFQQAETSPPLPSSYTFSCSLLQTQACNCSEAYTQCAVSCPEEPTPSIPPVEAPQLPPTSTPTTSSPTPTGCSSPRPTPEFACINGVWTAPSTNVTILTIPANSGSLLITGNVSSSSIVFEGVIGTTITINGCANNLTTIVIQLSQEEILKIDKSGSKTFTLLTQTNAPSSCAGLGNVAVNTRTDKGCRTATSRKVVSDDGKSLGAIISVDSSGCNRWWIILVSVVVVVVILGAIIIAVGTVLWKRREESKQRRSLKAPAI